MAMSASNTYEKKIAYVYNRSASRKIKSASRIEARRGLDTSRGLHHLAIENLVRS